MKISEKKGKIPTRNRALNNRGGGGGPSVAEVAAFLPARLLGTIEELEKESS